MKDTFAKFNMLENDMNFIIVYHFYLKELKLKKSKKTVTHLHDKTEYVIHIRNPKQALNHGLVLKEFHGVIYQNAWLILYIDMNTKLRQKAKDDFEKRFFKVTNNAVFVKAVENVRKNRYVKLVTTEKRRHCLVSDTATIFTKNLLPTEMKKLKFLWISSWVYQF